MAVPRHCHLPASEPVGGQGTHTDTIPYTDATSDLHAAQVSDRERSGSLGWPKFLPRSELGLSVANNRQYLKDDCLIFRIVSVKLN